MNTERHSLTMLLALAVLVAPASRASAPQPPASPTSISVVPSELTLRAGATHQLLITGHTPDGWEADLTRNATFTSSDPEVARIDRGILTALKPGRATITIESNHHKASAAVHVTAGAGDQPLTFVNDVLPILTKAGCSAGGCHAKKEGQNGFKLSIFAYDPESDYHEIVKESRGRRIFPASPAESLLLKKPTMTVDHQGGRRFDEGSPSYNTLLSWIQQGMPYSHPNDPGLKEITVTPQVRRYRKQSVQPLLVQAHYSDGSIRDITGLTEFGSNEKDIAQVDDSGIITIGSLEGETVIVCRFMGLVAISRITIPAERALDDSLYAALPVNNPIDQLAYARFKTLGLLPSEGCSDGEFLRRATLDSIGRLPTLPETTSFLADVSPDKRSRTIERLLQDKAYPHVWAIRWGDLIRPNPSRVGVKPVYLLDLWLRESFRQNKPYNRMVTELLTARGSTHDYGPAVVFRDHREPDEAASFVSQVFLGVRMECAQCHHHPNEKWSQDDYYQLAAFFSEVKRKGQGISAPISGLPEFIYHGRGGQVTHPVTGAIMKPKPLASPAPEIEEGHDPRAVLVDWICAPDNPYFAHAIVNRIWSFFMGRGIVDPVDDFRASNPPSNGPLLDWLARDFVEHGYDLKHLMRTIMESHLYQLSSLPNDTNLADTTNHSRSYRRRLSAEVLLDAVSDLTGTGEHFEGMPPGTRACETWNNKIDSNFLDAFGRPDASAECPCERDRQTSVVQALHLMNSNRLQEKISDKQGRAAALAAGSLAPARIIDELYLASYSRYPTEEETTIALGAFGPGDASRQAATEDVLWALINSAEFVFNH